VLWKSEDYGTDMKAGCPGAHETDTQGQIRPQLTGSGPRPPGYYSEHTADTSFIFSSLNKNVPDASPIMKIFYKL
jgi:hypothetical protein